MEIRLDLDRNRIRTVLQETYDIAKDVLQCEFNITAEEFISKVDAYLVTNRINIPVRIDLPCRKFPGLVIEVDLRRAKVFSRIPSHARNHPKQVLLNRFLKAL